MSLLLLFNPSPSAGGNTYEEAITLSAISSMSEESYATFVSAFSLAVDSVLSDSSNATHVVQVIASAVVQAQQAGYLTAQEAVAVAANVATQFAVTVTYQGSVNMSADTSATMQSLGTFGHALALSVLAQVELYGTKAGEAFLAYLVSAILDD